MKYFNLIQLVFVFLSVSNGNTQEYFEGKIEYMVTYETLSPDIYVSYLEKEIGTSFTAYIQEDRFAMIYHATGEQGWMKAIIRLDENYTYIEYEKSDVIVKTKFGSQDYKFIALRRNLKDQKEVLGELCESVSIEYNDQNSDPFYKNFKGTYYFNPKYKLNTKLYKNYTEGLWNLITEETGTISLRNESEYGNLFKSVEQATAIEQKSIPNAMFEPNAAKKVYEKYKQ